MNIKIELPFGKQLYHITGERMNFGIVDHKEVYFNLVDSTKDKIIAKHPSENLTVFWYRN